MHKPHAMATIPALDLERAKAWYKDKLGLTPAGQDPLGGAVYELADGTRFLLFQSSGAPSGTHTQLALEVEDADSTFRDLRGRGVKFEEYDVPGLKTEDRRVRVAYAVPGLAAWAIGCRPSGAQVMQRQSLSAPPSPPPAAALAGARRRADCSSRRTTRPACAPP